MGKLKKIWGENSVLFVLFFILIACVVAIAIVVITYFVGNSNSKFGEREKNSFTQSDIDEVVDKIKEDETIDDASIWVSNTGTIYVTLKFDASIILVEAESKALATLEYFSEDILNEYDIEYQLNALETDENDGYTITGAHNAAGTGIISWNNNTVFETIEEE